MNRKGKLGCLLCGIAAAGLALAGCHGIPTKAEREARERQTKVSAEFRPHGHTPALPPLTPDSRLSNYVAYAMLNQPRVEAALRR